MSKEFQVNLFNPWADVMANLRHVEMAPEKAPVERRTKPKHDLPALDYVDVPEDPPKFLPSEHILHNRDEIQLMGLKPESTWKDQTAEFASHSSDARRVLFLRHGEGTHNAAERELGPEAWREQVTDTKFFDPALTEEGKAQAMAQAEALKPALESGELKIDCILVSPLTRAIQTAEIVFKPIWNTVPVVAIEFARERFGINQCDKRRKTNDLKRKHDIVNFDGGYMLGNEDPLHKDDRRETMEELRSRASKFVTWLMTTPHKTIAVSSHSRLISHIVTLVGYREPHFPSPCELMPVMLKYAEWTSVQKLPDGTKVKENKNGDKFQENTDGTIIENFADGTVKQVNPDGAIIEVTDQRTVQWEVDGTLLEKDHVTGESKTTYLNGRVIVMDKDGVKLQTNPDGSTVQTFPDGKKVFKDKPSG